MQNDPIIYFNQNTVMQTNSEKNPCFFDTKLNCKKPLANTLIKANKKVSLLNSVIIYKSFIRPQPLNYGDLIYDQTYNASFHKKIEKMQNWGYI